MARRETSTDPRAIRTRQTLIDSTIELLKNNRSEVLSVSQIVKAGNLSRQVFYEHFSDRDALLVAAGEKMINPSINRTAPGVASGEAFDDLLLGIFEELTPYRDSLANLSDGPAHWRMHSYGVQEIYPLVEAQLKSGLQQAGEDATDEELRYTAEFIASGMIERLTGVIKAGLSATEARRVNQLVRETLSKALSCHKEEPVS